MGLAERLHRDPTPRNVAPGLPGPAHSPDHPALPPHRGQGSHLVPSLPAAPSTKSIRSQRRVSVRWHTAVWDSGQVAVGLHGGPCRPPSSSSHLSHAFVVGPVVHGPSRPDSSPARLLPLWRSPTPVGPVAPLTSLTPVPGAASAESTCAPSHTCGLSGKAS